MRPCRASIRVRFLVAVAILTVSVCVSPRDARADVDISGDWNAALIALLDLGGHCNLTFSQTGPTLSATGSCDSLGGGAGGILVSGTIDPVTGDFSMSGVGGGCYGDVAGPTVSQTLSGTVTATGDALDASFDCMVSGAPPSSSSLSIVGSPATACGDGDVDAGEQCDDGNAVDGDGCSAVCRRGPGDDVKCYPSRTTRGTPKFSQQTVSVADQFGGGDMQLLRADDVCLPAAIGFGGGILDVNAPLACYRAKDLSGGVPAGASDIEFRNDLTNRAQSIRLKKAKRVCVFAERDGLAASLGIDDFKCYKGGGSRGIANRVVVDAFGGEIKGIGRPKLFCSPAVVDGGAASEPLSPLVCYRGDRSEFDDRDVTLSSQLGDEARTLRAPRVVCARSVQCDPLPAACAGACGDGVVDPACCETCDLPFSAGGAVGCSDQCRDTCLNGQLEPAAGEECDSGNDDACPGECDQCVCNPGP